MHKHIPSPNRKMNASSNGSQTKHRGLSHNVASLIQRSQHAPQTLSSSDIVLIQRTLGNQATLALIQRSAQEVDDTSFDDIVHNSDQLVLALFWTEGVDASKSMIPLVDELSDEYVDRAQILKVETDSNPETTAHYNIKSVPTVLFFKGGELIEKQIGATSKTALQQKIDRNLE